MDLMASARVLDDQNFIWRVKAACLNHASTQVTGTGKAHALSVLQAPHNVDPVMLALVSVDDDVSSAVTVEDGAVDTSKVSDDAIITAVAAAWETVANK